MACRRAILSVKGSLRESAAVRPGIVAPEDSGA